MKRPLGATPLVSGVTLRWSPPPAGVSSAPKLLETAHITATAAETIRASARRMPAFKQRR
jgi:hypothetical protein